MYGKVGPNSGIDRDLRIENTLADGNGNEVRLKKGAHVEVTVTARPKK